MSWWALGPIFTIKEIPANHPVFNLINEFFYECHHHVSRDHVLWIASFKPLTLLTEVTWIAKPLTHLSLSWYRHSHMTNDMGHTMISFTVCLEIFPWMADLDPQVYRCAICHVAHGHPFLVRWVTSIGKLSAYITHCTFLSMPHGTFSFISLIYFNVTDDNNVSRE